MSDTLGRITVSPRWNYKDLIGQSFGHLTVLKRAPDGKRNPNAMGHNKTYVRWLCRCECGTESTVSSGNLLRGSAYSCGCRRRDVGRERKYADLTGLRFGKLLVRKRVKDARSGHGAWLCICDCGNFTYATTGSLRHTRKSCGCNSILPLGEAAKRGLLRQYKAQRRGHAFTLTDEEAFRLFEGNCFYCGLPPSRVIVNSHYNGRFIASGIDRMDNALGYTSENSVSCCGVCNLAKRELSVEEFLEWMERLHSFQQLRKLRNAR